MTWRVGVATRLPPPPTSAQVPSQSRSSFSGDPRGSPVPGHSPGAPRARLAALEKGQQEEGASKLETCLQFLSPGQQHRGALEGPGCPPTPPRHMGAIDGWTEGQTGGRWMGRIYIINNNNNNN